MTSTPDFRYVYFWNRMGCKGQRCAVLARGKLNSCLVMFEDGFTAVTDRRAVRRIIQRRLHYYDQA
jgi:hypothetical protein